MDLYSGHPWWIAKNGLLHSYPALDEDVDCDVLVVGAGITGALIADALAAAGMSVAVIDRREAGWGSTAASTALLQYEIDTELQDLATQRGDEECRPRLSRLRAGRASPACHGAKMPRRLRDGRQHLSRQP